MAQLTSNGNGTFTLTPTARETATVVRATPAGMTALQFMEAKITAWIREVRNRQDEQDAAIRQAKYEAATAQVKAEVDALLG